MFKVGTKNKLKKPLTVNKITISKGIELKIVDKDANYLYLDFAEKRPIQLPSMDFRIRISDAANYLGAL